VRTTGSTNNESPKTSVQSLAQAPRLRQFIKFCLVGGSGVAVDMAVLYFLAEPAWCGWNVTLSKVCSAETAMLNNFLWNEVWTFRSSVREQRTWTGVASRLWRFHAICGVGIGLAVLFLHLFYTALGLNLYFANFLAIVLVTLWNFWMNALFNWCIAAHG